MHAPGNPAALSAALIALTAATFAVAAETSRMRAGHSTIEAPPAAHTGGFGEETCAKCHFGLPLNADSGTLVLEGLPARYFPGSTYDITVRLSRRRMFAAGFELSSRFAAGAHRGLQSGALAALDSRAGVTTVDSTGVQYAHHVRGGIRLTASGAASWRLRWTAPVTAERVVFHVTANAADDDNSPGGDFIYSTEVTLEPLANRLPGR